MKISVEDGVVVCSLENKIDRFLSKRGAYGCFYGFYKGKLKIFVPFQDEEYEARVIRKIIHHAKEYEVEVEEAVYDRLKALEASTEAKRLREVEERQKREKAELWKRKCERGCGKCEFRKNALDDTYCAASGDLLEERHVPKYINGVHYLFNYEPFPSENCVYKIN